MKALILAAGKGERLKSITKRTPKVMVKIKGKPCLQYNIELLKKYGITDIAINTHYLPKKIIEYFGDGKKFGVKINYSYEHDLLGTAGALNHFFNFFNDEDFIVIYGDVIHNTNLKELINFHKINKGIGTLTLDTRSQEGRGAVILKGSIIKGFVEKPEKEIPEALVNSGIYVLSPKILKYIPYGFADFGKDIFPKILKTKEKLYGFRGDLVIDIGTVKDLREAEK